MQTFLFFLLSIPLYICSIFLIHAFSRLNYSAGETAVFTALLSGFAAGLLLFTFISRFTKFYIFGHELAHWIFAKLFMRETQNFSVGKDGGAVQVKDPNIWISLAPYFYPTFTILWVPTWFAFKYFEKDFKYSPHIFFGILAFTWSYHFVLTLYALKFEQSDLKRYGKPISFALIMFINLFIIFIFLSLFTDNPLQACKIYWQVGYEDSVNTFYYIKGLINGK